MKRFTTIAMSIISAAAAIHGIGLRGVPSANVDVERCETSATELTPDTELFTVLSSQNARVAGEEAQSRKLSRVRSCTGAADVSLGRTNTYTKTTRRRRRTCTALPRRVVFHRTDSSRRNHGSALRSHAQRVSGLLKNDEGRAEAVGKAGRD